MLQSRRPAHPASEALVFTAPKGGAMDDHNGKQRFKCQECGRQFVEQPTKKVIDAATRELIDRLLLERISLAGIARATQVSAQWLQTYVNEKYAQVPRSVQVSPKKKGA
jgi:transposase-like protein